MDDLCVKVKGQWFENLFDKDWVSVEEIIEKLELAIDERDYYKQKLEDFKKDVEDNYRPLTFREQIGE